jgi:PAS domain S-box-containing protein/putative nucleotidyltransferase with HDIG domain
MSADRTGTAAAGVAELQQLTECRWVEQTPKTEETMDTAMEWLRALIENASDGIALLDDKWMILYESPSAERIVGQKPEQLEGTSFLDLIHQDDMQQAVSLLESVMENQGKTATCQVRVKHKDGSWRAIEATAKNLIHDPRLGGIVVNYRDITESKKAQQELEQSEKKYRLFADNLSDVIWTMDTNLRCTYLSPSVTSLRGYSVEEAMALSMKHTTTPASLQTFLRVMAEAEAKEGLGSSGEHSPATLDLELTCKDGSTVWTENRITCLRDSEGQLAGYLGVSRDITERREASRRLERSLQKLERTLEGTIQAIARTVGCRDSYTAEHQTRVAQLACAIAGEMGFAPEQVEAVQVAGLLHDIGKLSVPQDLLCKPGKLTDVEYELIKTHCKAGYDILRRVEFPWPIADIVVQHHERMNGSGYPSGIKEGEILIEARILAVADVVEAMNSYRAYRAPLGLDKALNEISRNSGILYDPTVVDACIRLFAQKKFQFEDQSTGSPASVVS